MKWALLSDIHANIQALDACADHARRQGAQRWAVLGDLVGYGAVKAPACCKATTTPWPSPRRRPKAAWVP